MSWCGPAPVGQPDDLEAVAELAVGGLAEGLFEASGLGVGQLDADHGRAEVGGGWFASSFYEPDSISGLVNETLSLRHSEATIRTLVAFLRLMSPIGQGSHYSVGESYSSRISTMPTSTTALILTNRGIG